ncbi:hypothetical protein BH23VER1_BH23VER1_33720 [soil metagenome]
MKNVKNTSGRSRLAGCVGILVLFWPLVGAAADSPKAVAVQVAEALRAGDVNAFVAGFDATDEEVEFLNSLGTFAAAAVDFRDKFIKAYGLDYWNAFQNYDDPPGAHDFAFTNVTEAQVAELKALDDAKLRETRQVKLPNTATVQSLVERDGQWFIDASTMLPPNASMAAMTRHVKATTAIVERYAKLIGKDDVLARDIDHDMGRALHEFQSGRPSPEPARIHPDAFEN